MVEMDFKEAEYYESITYNFDDIQYFMAARTLAKYAVGKRVLDLGCGPILHISGHFFTNAEKIVGCDLLPENIEFIKKRFLENEVTEKHHKAFEYLYQRFLKSTPPAQPKDLVQSLNDKTTLLIHDAKIRNVNFESQFDTVVQSGLLGCLKNKEELQTVSNHCYSYLRPGGKVVWINWVRNQPPEKNPTYFGSDLALQLSKDVYKEALLTSGFRIEKIRETKRVRPFSKQRGYNKVVWAVAARD